MTPTPNISELLRTLGEDALIHEAESFGLSPRARRLRCPFPSCSHKGPSRERDAVIFAGKHPRIHCYACSSGGDYLDLLGITRGFSPAEALAHVTGLAVEARPLAPSLRVVGSPANDADKMPSSEVRRIWESLAEDDDTARPYLESRHLDDAIDAGLVRFAQESSANKVVASLARKGHRVAALLSDVTGAPRGIQLRLVRATTSKESKVLSVKGSVTSRAFFGAPGLIEASPVVAVAEGMADTLALALWAGPHAVAVGAAGKSFLRKLAEELELAGIDVRGKLFALFPQNDRPQNQSRREFTQLAQLLTARGASVCWCATPDEFKDLADWRQSSSEVAWPPDELTRYLSSVPGDDAAPSMVLPPGHGVPMPAQYRVERYDSDFTTLCALLDDASTREAVLGRGELSWCEMRQRALIGERTITEEDLPRARTALEQFRRASDGKPLRWPIADIASAIPMLASRKTVHPVRQWLTGLRWDGVPRTGQLAEALGQTPVSFAEVLLRRWLVSAVARAMTPGCKVDTVLVLVGPQGAGKSTFFSALAGEPWHTDSRVDVADKDGKLIMRQAWVVEWAELDSMRRAKDQEAVKAFLSARVDLFRKPYAREVQEAPRHSVIVGTTNNREFLHDVTGSRRFWPIDVTRIDVDWVKANRDQLWAEATAAFRRGDNWWLTQEEGLELAERNREHEPEDVWTDPVRDWLDEHRNVPEVTVGQLLKFALDRDVDEWTRADENRVGAILRQLGWTLARARRDGTVLRLWARPEVRK